MTIRAHYPSVWCVCLLQFQLLYSLYSHAPTWAYPNASCGQMCLISLFGFCCYLQEDKLNALIKAAGVTVEPFWPSLFAKVRSCCWLNSSSNMLYGHLKPEKKQHFIALWIIVLFCQALGSVDIGSLICNVGAGGGAPAAAAAGAPAAGGDAPGKCSHGFCNLEAVHAPFWWMCSAQFTVEHKKIMLLVVTWLLTLFPNRTVFFFFSPLQPRRRRRRKKRRRSPKSLMMTWASVSLTKLMFL